MSTQRRRVLGLEIDKGETTITKNGIYIEGLNGKFYTASDWRSGNDANSIVVALTPTKFRISLKQVECIMNNDREAPLENYMTAITDVTAARADYDGAGNTAKILQMEPRKRYAAGYCTNYTFPDGKTKGYIPSFGQLYLTCINKANINAALSACGGAALTTSSYWSSTFRGILDNDYRFCWILGFGNCYGSFGSDLSYSLLTRPFAKFP